jgi:hypothetical protein
MRNPIVLVGFSGFDAVAIECERPFADRIAEWQERGYAIDFLRLDEAKRLVGLYIAGERAA